jgi:hypothetical protein
MLRECRVRIFSATLISAHSLPRSSVSATAADKQERDSPINWRVRMAVSGIGAAGAVGAYSLTPTIAPTLATTSAATIDLRNIALSSASVVSSTPSPTMTVTLGNPVTPDVTYGKPAPVDPEKLVWATPPADSISQLMAQLKSADPSSLLGGLGAELLNRFPGQHERRV